MKKAAAIGMASFYLLLTTGMFVCLAHCSAEYFFLPRMAMHDTHGCDKQKTETTANHNDKKCNDKDCGCCKKHGSFVVKENLKTDTGSQYAPVALSAYRPLFAYYLNEPPVVIETNFVYGKAPPGKSGKCISIQFRSLQI